MSKIHMRAEKIGFSTEELAKCDPLLIPFLGFAKLREMLGPNLMDHFPRTVREFRNKENGKLFFILTEQFYKPEIGLVTVLGGITKSGNIRIPQLLYTKTPQEFYGIHKLDLLDLFRWTGEVTAVKKNSFLYRTMIAMLTSEAYFPICKTPVPSAERIKVLLSRWGVNTEEYEIISNAKR